MPIGWSRSGPGDRPRRMAAEVQSMDDRELAGLLREVGLGDDPHNLQSLLAGIAAAPEGADADAWLELVGERLPETLKAALRARRAALRPPDPADGDHGERLRSLREVLRQRGVDGFVLMRTDEHGSEYLPGYAER